MLFFLDKSLLDATKNPPDKALLISCLTELMNGRKKGRLLVYAQTSKDISDISNIYELSAETRFILKRCADRWKHKGSTFNHLSAFVRLTYRDGNIAQYINSGNVTEIDIPISQFRDTFTHQPILMGENISDAKLYSLIAEVTTQNIDEIPKVSMRGDIRGGGGSTTPAEYAHIKAVGDRLCLCITDSDLIEPGADYSPSVVATSLIKEDTNNPPKITKGIIVDAHAAENFIPPELLGNLISYKKNGEKFQEDERDLLKKFSALDSWKHLPVKKGIKCNFIKGTTSAATYWRTNVISVKPNYSSMSCRNRENLQACSDSCNVVPAVLGSTLSDFVTHYESPHEKHELMKKFHTFTPVIRSLWCRISRDVASWTCVGDRIQT